jgi:hypothetical protein
VPPQVPGTGGTVINHDRRSDHRQEKEYPAHFPTPLSRTAPCPSFEISRQVSLLNVVISGHVKSIRAPIRSRNGRSRKLGCLFSSKCCLLDLKKGQSEPKTTSVDSTPSQAPYVPGKGGTVITHDGRSDHCQERSTLPISRPTFPDSPQSMSKTIGCCNSAAARQFRASKRSIPANRRMKQPPLQTMVSDFRETVSFGPENRAIGDQNRLR